MSLSSVEWSQLRALEQELIHVQLSIEREEDFAGPALPHLKDSYVVETYLKDRIKGLKIKR